MVLGLGALTPDERGYGTHEQLGLAPCAVREGIGIPCPACGVTTAVSLAARGDLLASLATQPLGLVLALGAPLVALLALLWHLAGRDLSVTVVNGRWARTVVLALAGLVLAAWLYKLRQFGGAG